MQRVLCLAALLLAASAQAAPAGTAYVSNQNGDVMAIDLASMTVAGKLSSYGKEARGLGVTADGKLMVFADGDSGSISVVDRESGKLLRHVAIGANPEFVRTRGHFAFVSYEPQSTGKPPPRPDAASAASASAGPPAKGKDDDDEVHDPAHVAVVDLDAGKVVRSIRAGRETEGIEFSPDGKQLVVANEADNTLTVYEMDTGKLLRTVDLKSYGNRPRGIKVSPDGKTYVTTLEFSNLLLVLDSDFKVVRSVKTADAPYGVAFDRSGDRVFVAAARSKLLQVFDARTWNPLKDITTGQRCWHFSFTPDDRSLLLACGRSSEIVVVDAQKLEVTQRIPDKDLPWGVVTYPKSMGSLDKPE